MTRKICLMAAGALALAACGDRTAAEAEAPSAPEPEMAETDMAAADMAAPVDCARDCLTSLIDQYLAALTAGDPAVLPLASHVRFTEDQTDMEIGEGLWAGDVALTDYRFDIIDVQEEIAASLVTAQENGNPVLLALRLITQDGVIEGVETLVVRSAEEGMIFNIDAIQTLSDAMAYTPTAGERMDRQAMLDAAIRYPRGLQVGSFVESDVPFSADAYRFENGMLMAGPGCTFFPGCEAIKEQSIPTLAGLAYHTSAIDEEQGVVLIRMDFGPGSIMPAPGRDENTSLSVFEAFKVWGGEVHAVEAFMEIKPADQPLGWR